MVHALAPDRSDQSFGKAVLPRRTWRDGLVTDAHRSHSARRGSAVDLIAISDQVARSLIPRECLRDLVSNPFRGRMRGDIDQDKSLRASRTTTKRRTGDAARAGRRGDRE